MVIDSRPRSMAIVIVSAKQETATLSLVDAKKRLEETKAEASAANEKMFEALLLIDPDEYADLADRIYAQTRIDEAEAGAKRAWARYEEALIRYDWEMTTARKFGVII